MVCSRIFLPNNARLIKDITKKLQYIFKEPEKHVVIVNTKAYSFSSHFDADEDFPMA